jgi:ATP-dependent DNA helicase RecQ
MRHVLRFYWERTPEVSQAPRFFPSQAYSVTVTQPTRAAALALLQTALGDQNADFRDGQWEAIQRLVGGRERLLVVQRTGWGKSVVYFIASKLLRDAGAGPTLLISPLLTLMRNQLAAAQRIGVRAETINSSNVSDWEGVKRKLAANEVDILLVSPERLSNEEFRQQVLVPMQRGIGLFVVDEAHCISDWGHDFRPDYRRIKALLNVLPLTVPVLATTATANDRVVRDVQSQLGDTVTVLRGPLTRQSLRLQNIQIPSAVGRFAWLADHVPTLPGSGIIYTLTVRDAERVAEWLRENGVDAHAYYGGLDGPTKESLERRLLANDLKVLVATTALGMGFDKPDLGFVIHYQRPGSVVHYYQQVGRAGRAVTSAYGILLNGDEDEQITEYFIAAAFPPEGHVNEVLHALDEAEDGLSIPGMEEQLNLSRGQIEKVLHMLAADSPSPVRKVGSRWTRTAVPYIADPAKVERLQVLRRDEQQEMGTYMENYSCLMQFLAEALDDAAPAPCGVCAVCEGRELVPVVTRQETEQSAVIFLRRSDQLILPRKRWASRAMYEKHGWRGNIRPGLQAQEGRSLSVWGDPAWGQLVRRGKQQDGRFDDALVEGAAEMIRGRWVPTPAPEWVTAVPSNRHPTLVPDFARRLAVALGLPFVEAVRKILDSLPQKTMQNSAQQAANVAGTFEVDPSTVRPGPVLLVDDMVDSRWSFTVIAALLRDAGSGPIFPLALAVTAHQGGDD